MSQSEALMSRLRRRREEVLSELAEIDAALRRIDESRYGLCGRCGQVIDAGRLAQHPATSWCRDCKQDYERRRGIVETDETKREP